jgi:hypothetical protein
VRAGCSLDRGAGFCGDAHRLHPAQFQALQIQFSQALDRSDAAAGFLRSRDWRTNEMNFTNKPD